MGSDVIMSAPKLFEKLGCQFIALDLKQTGLMLALGGEVCFFSPRGRLFADLKC